MLIQVNGIDVNFEERGSGWPILMLHGGYLDHRHMMDEMEPAFLDRAGWHRIPGDTISGMRERSGYQDNEATRLLFESLRLAGMPES
ncbi:hypothetical protein [Nioella aestuarii]|uniref:hypothetical protein n=1 Tax=Nioella aestuarii TaxID=1662864 RepID=UPI003D7F3E85